MFVPHRPTDIVGLCSDFFFEISAAGDVFLSYIFYPKVPKSFPTIKEFSKALFGIDFGLSVFVATCHRVLQIWKTE